MQVKLNPLGKISFPGFQEILDFTSAGSESSVSVTVDGDVDKEYKVWVRNVATSPAISITLNNDTGTNYGRQYLYNAGGTITADRGARSVLAEPDLKANNIISLLTPQGFVKTASMMVGRWGSGTTMDELVLYGYVYNSTSNITLINFFPNSGNFTAGTRITVYARRSN